MVEKPCTPFIPLLLTLLQFLIFQFFFVHFKIKVFLSCFWSLFGSIVAVVFQSIFGAKIHQNDVILFLRSMHQNDSKHKKIIF